MINLECCLGVAGWIWERASALPIWNQVEMLSWSKTSWKRELILFGVNLGIQCVCLFVCFTTNAVFIGKTQALNQEQTLKANRVNCLSNLTGMHQQQEIPVIYMSQYFLMSWKCAGSNKIGMFKTSGNESCDFNCNIGISAVISSHGHLLISECLQCLAKI